MVKRILETLIKYGARPAEPGEFTKRAFLNGRLDLSQAEAVGDIITSQNEYALKSSISQLNGNIKTKISEIRNKIIYHTAFIAVSYTHLHRIKSYLLRSMSYRERLIFYHLPDLLIQSYGLKYGVRQAVSYTHLSKSVPSSA